MNLLLTPDNIANDVRMRRTQYHGALILLEGSDDARFYKRFILPTECQLISTHAKSTLIQVLSLMEEDERLVGIADSDFDRLDNAAARDNLVLTDCHDLEATLLRSRALDAVLHELASDEKLRRFEDSYGGSLRSWLLETGRWLGYLRWNSLRLGINLRFEGLRFSAFVDRKSLKLDPPALFNELRNRSQNWEVPDGEFERLGCPTDRDDDPWQLCCGHDLVELLVLSLRGAVASQQAITPGQVGRLLRLAFSGEDFAECDMNVALRRWQDRAGVVIVPRRGVEQPPRACG